MEQILVKKEPEELVDDSEKAIKIDQIYIKQEIEEELDDVLFDKGYSSLTVNMFKHAASDSFNPRYLHGLPSTSADQEPPSTSGIAIKQGMDDDKAWLDKGTDSEVVNKEILAKEVLSKSEKECEDVDKVGKEKLFKCGICLKKYQTRDGLNDHKKYFHRKEELEKFKCNKCDYITVRKGSFKIHLKTHNKTNCLKCHFCQYMAVTLQTLNSHMLSKHKEENKIKITSKIHQCTKCLYSSVYKSSYDNHIKVCWKLKDVKWYQCEICHYKTVRNSNLIKHIKTHNKIKELKCSFCNEYQSDRKLNLDNHILIKHLDLLNENNKNLISSKIHCCQLCEFKTAKTNSLKMHFKNNH
ncbi:unnamed protein product [Brassicogethes aeneus]|uniref:C2H2-type domain-containing protein n=1 Tax=Brassicogethes aeneus TaxID=1431903 RepID=A0A9P0BIG0_BRAAE|nr:unnamed protein product [Brassicogethes aeneus]